MWKSHIIKQKTGPEDLEFQATLEDAFGQVAPADVIAIADELADRQSRLFSGLKPASDKFFNPSFEVFSAVTHSKANARTLASYFAQSDNILFGDLLNGEAPTPQRVENFVKQAASLDTRLALELATGLLHNIAPQEHWLWTRWLWDPTTGTGILPLLAGSTHNLLSDNFADGYARVGAVSALSLKLCAGTGLFSAALADDEQHSPFTASAFLACAYSVYMYGATSWRLSREFTRLLPALPNMARKLLGLPRIKVVQSLVQS